MTCDWTMTGWGRGFVKGQLDRALQFRGSIKQLTQCVWLKTKGYLWRPSRGGGGNKQEG